MPLGYELPDRAFTQDGVFTRAQARAEGWSDSRQRRLLRDGLWVSVAGSVFRHRDVEEGPWQRARAVALSGRVPSHSTAAAIWGYAIPAADCHGIVEHVAVRPGDCRTIGCARRPPTWSSSGA